MFDLKVHNLLRHFTDEEFDLLRTYSKQLKYSKGQVVQPGDFGRNLYVVLKGYGIVLADCDNGREHVVLFAGPGMFFGATSHESEAEFWTRFLTEAEILCIPQKLYMKLLCSPKFNQLMMDTLTKRLMKSHKRLSLQLTDTAQRLEYILLDLLKQFGEHTQDGIILPFRITNKDLAAYCETTKETISRILSRFTDAGKIDLRTGRVMVSHTYLTTVAA